MGVFCNTDCLPICDFCIYYKDAGHGTDKFHGEGICLKHNTETDACSMCEDFHCFNVRNEEYHRVKELKSK